MLRAVWIAAGVVVLVCLASVTKQVSMLAGFGKKLETQLVGMCQRVDIAPGLEDIQYDPSTGLVFISSADRRAHPSDPNKSTAPTNGIYVLDVSPERIADVRDATPVLPEGFGSFNPHGIFLWDDGAEDKRLFAVNHASSGEEIVEIFQVGDGGALTHLESVSFPEMFLPNDVVATGPRQFYATNFLRFDHGVMAIIETVLGLPLTSVVYFDGEAGKTVAKGLAFANGINLSPDKKTLYVAEFAKHRIVVFDRNEDNSLTKRSKFRAPMAVDNLDIDEDGNIWSGGHPKMFDFIDHVEDASATAPSMGIVVDSETGEWETVFVSKEGEINASSVAAIAGDKLLIGAVFDGHVMVCDGHSKPQ